MLAGEGEEFTQHAHDAVTEEGSGGAVESVEVEANSSGAADPQTRPRYPVRLAKVLGHLRGDGRVYLNLRELRQCTRETELFADKLRRELRYVDTFWHQEERRALEELARGQAPDVLLERVQRLRLYVVVNVAAAAQAVQLHDAAHEGDRSDLLSCLGTAAFYHSLVSSPVFAEEEPRLRGLLGLPPQGALAAFYGLLTTDSTNDLVERVMAAVSGSCPGGWILADPLLPPIGGEANPESAELTRAVSAAVADELLPAALSKGEHQQQQQQQQQQDSSDDDTVQQQPKQVDAGHGSSQLYLCRDCCMVLNSFRQAQIHTGGQRHVDRVKRLRQSHESQGLPFQPSVPQPYHGDCVANAHKPRRARRPRKKEAEKKAAGGTDEGRQWCGQQNQHALGEMQQFMSMGVQPQLPMQGGGWLQGMELPPHPPVLPEAWGLPQKGSGDAWVQPEPFFPHPAQGGFVLPGGPCGLGGSVHHGLGGQSFGAVGATQTHREGPPPSAPPPRMADAGHLFAPQRDEPSSSPPSRDSQVQRLISAALFDSHASAVDDLRKMLADPRAGGIRSFVDGVFEGVYAGHSCRAYARLCGELLQNSDPTAELNTLELKYELTTQCRRGLEPSAPTGEQHEALALEAVRSRLRVACVARLVTELYLMQIAPEALVHVALQRLLHGGSVTLELAESATSEPGEDELGAACRMLRATGERLRVSSAGWVRVYCDVLQRCAPQCHARTRQLVTAALKACGVKLGDVQSALPTSAPQSQSPSP
eukprot:Hpha_TRINITY_DN16673_c2_g12::TRINITY_DN16673_c2_g12_i1::g.180814::m.180814